MILRLLRRVIAGVLSVLATAIGVTLVALALIACTETGLRLAWPQVQALLPAGISVGAVDGRLIGPLTLRDVDIHGETRDIHVSSLRLRWRPSRLLRGVLAVDSLTLRGVDVTANPDAVSEPTELPERYPLPLRVRVDELSVDDVHYRSAPGAEPVAIRHAGLTVAAGPDAVDVRHIAVVAPLCDLHGGLRVVPAGAYPVSGELRWHLRPPGYAEVAGDTRLSGSLRELHVAQRVAAPYAIDARGVIRNAVEDPNFSIDLTINGMQLAKISPDLQPIKLNANSHLAGSVDAVSYTLKARVQTPDYGTLHASSEGDYRSRVLYLRSLLLTLDGSPTRVTGHGQVTMGAAAPAVDAAIDWHQARWPLHGKATFTSAQGHVLLKGTADDLSAAIRAAVGGRGHIEGHVERHGERIALNVDWRDLSWPLSPPRAEKPRMLSPRGSLQMNGTLAAYRLQLSARVDVPGQTGGHVRAAGRGDRGSIALDTVDIDTLRGRIQGRASAAWKPALAFDARLSGHGIDPGALLPKWPGRVDFRVDAEGKTSAAGLRVDVRALTASGRLRGQPLRVSARGRYAAGSLDLAQLDAALGDSRVSARGHAGKTLDLVWEAHSDDLGKLLPQLAGSLDAKGRARGTVAVPRVSVVASGHDLSYADSSLRTFELNAAVDMSGASRSHVDLRARGGEVAGTALRSLELHGEGVPRDHELKLTARSSRGDANLQLHGDYHDAAWAFRLGAARVRYPGLAPWTLAAPADGLVGRHRMRLSQACWTSGDAQLCAQGERGADGVQGEFELKNLGFDYFAALLPSGLAVTGRLDAQGRFRMPAGGGVPEAQLELDTTAGDVASAVGGATARVVGFKRSRITLSLDGNGLRLQGGIELVQRGHLRLHARIPGGTRPLIRRPLSGEISADVNDISFISELVPQIGRVSGRLHGDMRVSGSVASPRVLGQLTLQDAAATLNGPGLQITGIRVVLTGRQSGAVHIQASARSGDGTLAVDGEADLAGRGPRVSLRIQGNAFQVFDTDDGRVWASPDLKVRLRDKEIRVDGTVRVPRARITPQQLPKSAVTVSDDQVIVHPGRKGAAASSAYKIYATVRLILGKDVRVEAFGLTGRLDGGLLVSAVPGEPVKGSGELRIEEGEYRAYGQGLVIERGRILFPGGPIDQPGVDVRAVRRPAEDVLVGVQVRGNLKNPDFVLFSDPSMTQAEQLSWLVLGKPLEGTSSDENSVITRAALALGLKEGNTLTKKFGDVLGIDSIGIESGSGEAGSASKPQQAALVIGKYLSPDLYVSYGIGLFDPVSTVKLQYTLSSKWKLATEASSVASGGDLIYTIERGH